MGIMKRFAERVSEAMGREGAIDRTVLYVASVALDALAKEARGDEELAIEMVVQDYARMLAKK